MVHATYTHLHFIYSPIINCPITSEFLCMLLRINYSRNYAGILDASLNEGYSSASVRFVPAVMLRQLTLFGKVAASQTV